MDKDAEFQSELRQLINRHSMERFFGDTPDFILAEYIMRCLYSWKLGVESREALSVRNAGINAAAPASGGEEK